MTSTSTQRVAELFGEAIEHFPDERAAFLGNACAGDDSLRAEVESLLAAHTSAGGFMQSASGDLDRSPAGGPRSGSADDDTIGRELGPYRIVRRLGAGGMGAVYLAERADATFEKQVAVKLIKRGMDTEDILQRFRVERQVLARLEHANIARLIDGGATADGAPYLVMEYVDGLPIDRYCDERRLGVRERLEIFRAVCAAVDSAHRHGVVHRDLKPGNVLVTADGVPKLLDFGIAKVLAVDEKSAADRTAPGLRLLSLRYASPEQVRGDAVTAASDVYSLGVLLYHLLTGHSPYPDTEGTGESLQRLVTEHAPERPSRVARTGRPTTGRIEGDLDTIVLKALRKEPERRYASAERFADDLRRFLDGLPVEAAPDSHRYRLLKFVRRNRIAVGSALLVFAALVAASVVSTGLLIVAAVLATVLYFQAVRARTAAEEAQAEAEAQRTTAEEITQFLQDMLGRIDPEMAHGRDASLLREILDETATRIDAQLAQQPEAAAALRTTIARTYWSLGLYDQAEPHVRAALATRRMLFGNDHRTIGDCLVLLGRICRDTARLEDSEAFYREALEIRERCLGATHGDVAQSLYTLGMTLEDRGAREEAEQCYRRALTIARQLDEHVHLGCSMGNLGRLLNLEGRQDEAEPYLREAVEMWRRVDPPEPMSLGQVLHNLACMLRDRGRPGDFEASAELFSEALEVQQAILSADHFNIALTQDALASLLGRQKRHNAAEPLHRAALESQRRSLGNHHHAVAVFANNLGECLRKMGRLDDAEELLREAIATDRAVLGDDHAWVGVAAGNLAATLLQSGKVDEAEEALDEAQRIQRLHGKDGDWREAALDSIRGACLTSRGEWTAAEELLLAAASHLENGRGLNDERTQQAVERLVQLYEAWSKPQAAAEWRQRLAIGTD